MPKTTKIALRVASGAAASDHLIVVGKGRLIADCSMRDFIARSSGSAVRVRTTAPDELVLDIAAEGGTASAGTDGTLTVQGMTADRVPRFVEEHLVGGTPVEEWVFARNPLPGG